tara:strand:- start:137 stop:343 length:207 start_codon:yes stop_codon:yes gene_type:complete
MTNKNSTDAEYRLDYYQKNKKKIQEYQKEYYQKHLKPKRKNNKKTHWKGEKMKGGLIFKDEKVIVKFD